MVAFFISRTANQGKNDLVLMDVGAEYHGYTADVNRTVLLTVQLNKN
jgi:Xaa-Pro aminopeptidase